MLSHIKVHDGFPKPCVCLLCVCGVCVCGVCVCVWGGGMGKGLCLEVVYDLKPVGFFYL